MIYATLQQFEQHLQTAFADDQIDAANQKLRAASRAIDDYLEVEPYGYFAASSATTTKRILGERQSFITLPAPLRGAVIVTAPAGFTVPNFDVEDLRLITLDGDGNPSRFIVWDAVYYQISGQWGYAEIPDQITEACLCLATHFWRNRDKALSGTVGDMQQEEQFPERDYPRTFRRLCDEFFKNTPAKPKGGLVFA